LGGDGVVTPTEKMDQTIVGIYWAYEGTPVWTPPPRLYNQVAAHITARNGMNAETPTLRTKIDYRI
jgi:uncharacterized protein (DUF2126 family)